MGDSVGGSSSGRPSRKGPRHAEKAPSKPLPVPGDFRGIEKAIRPKAEGKYGANSSSSSGTTTTSSSNRRRRKASHCKSDGDGSVKDTARDEDMAKATAYGAALSSGTSTEGSKSKVAALAELHHQDIRCRFKAPMGHSQGQDTKAASADEMVEKALPAGSTQVSTQVSRPGDPTGNAPGKTKDDNEHRYRCKQEEGEEDEQVGTLREGVGEGKRQERDEEVKAGGDFDLKWGGEEDIMAGLGLELDIVTIEEENTFTNSESYKLSESGTLTVDDFQIRRSGLARTPGGPTELRFANSGWDDVQSNIVQLELLGQGASGKVYKALHVPTLTLVAQKVIPVHDDSKRRQLMHEVRALYSNLAPLGWQAGAGAGDERGVASVHGHEQQGEQGQGQGQEQGEAPKAKVVASPCPQIVSFYDAFISPQEGNICMIVEYMDGGSLQDIVDAGGCSVEEVMKSITYQVLKGLDFLHSRKQIHRDIKPGNLLISHTGQVKISDFGIIRSLEDTMANAETFVGTFTYMSPERISGLKYSYAVDIWSLGLAIMTCAQGRFPYTDKGGYWGLLQALKDEEPPRLPEGEFSPEFCDFLAQCLQKDPSLRPSAKSLLNHPFLASGFDRSPSAQEPQEEEGSDTAREELDELADVVRKYYQQLWLHQAHSGISPTVPNLNVAKLRGLSLQVGLPVTLIQRKFRAMLAALKASIKQ